MKVAHRLAALVAAGMWLLPGVASAAAELKLKVDWNGVTLGRAMPVTGGVPLARGALSDARAVRLSAGERDVPLQAEVLARWPDKSVKWLLLDFQAATSETDLTLRYGPGVQAGEAPKGIVAAGDSGGVPVASGAV